MKYFRILHRGECRHVPPAAAVERAKQAKLELDAAGAGLEGATIVYDETSTRLESGKNLVERVICLELVAPFTELYDTEARVKQRLYLAFEGAISAGAPAPLWDVEYEYGDGGCAR